MNYKDNELGLTELLQGLELIPQTSPPVYILNNILIGYDKSERIKIIAGRRQPLSVKPIWVHPFKDWKRRFVR
ncbi:MAG: hypothetical protein KDI79_02945 [Anaerolineae bacterium]|nr:hypothetical protein [Anaerolineae bacterium]